MPAGFVTTDGIDFNEIYYGVLTPALDQYRQVTLPVIESLAMKHPEEILKWGIAAKNGYVELATGERPGASYVAEGVMVPVVKKYGYRIGTDLDTMRRSSARRIQMAINRGFAEDSENVLQQMMRVMLTDPGALNAGGGWYNGAFSTGEGITAPPTFQNNVFAANHTHYYRTGATTPATEDITNAVTHIRHHGHNGPLAGFINNVQRQALEDLATFTSTSIIRSPISDQVAVAGFQDRFQLFGVTFHVTEMVPSGYMAIVEVNQAEDQRPLVMFEPANMRGLEVHTEDTTYPLVNSFLQRWFGVRVWQRGAGVALQFATAGAYTNPTFA